MDAKILYFYIFGIITVATGKPASYNAEDSHYVRNAYELENLLQSLTGQGKLEVASNYGEVAPKAYYENRAHSSRYDMKPSSLYYKVDSPQYYESGENTNDKQPNINELQMINQFLEHNDFKPGSKKVQNLLEDLLALDRNNKFTSLKPSDETNDVDEIVALLGDLQRVSDEGNFRDYNVYDNKKGDQLRGNLFIEETDNPKVVKEVKSVLGQAKNGVMKLVENIVGNKPQYRDVEYLKLDDDELDRNDRDAYNYNVRDGLRCNGKNCARTNAVNDRKNTRLRCQGRYCTKTRAANNDNKFKYDSKLSAQKIKVNDELDAVVLELSDVDQLLTKLAAPKPQRTNKLRGAQILENLNIENLLNSRSNIGNKDNVEAIVFDLTNVENGDAVARQIKQLLSPTNEGSYDDYAEYGNLVENNLKQGIYDFQIPVTTNRANLNVSPYKKNNSNVYLPQWILDEVLSKPYSQVQERGQVSRSMFPLTRQQKERMNRNRKNQNQNAQRVYRRNLDQDVGVPFHMEVQGLGQVIP